jgi:hypothetical protein
MGHIRSVYERLQNYTRVVYAWQQPENFSGAPEIMDAFFLIILLIPS